MSEPPSTNVLARKDHPLGLALTSARRSSSDMQVSRVAYDRFVLELPPAEADWRPLADPAVAHETAGWLWEFGPTPLIAVVSHEGPPPIWLAGWLSFGLAFEGASATAVLIESRKDLERFLQAGAPHERTRLLWPRVSPAKTFQAISAGGDQWVGAVDAHAHVERAGSVVEVIQAAPA